MSSHEANGDACNVQGRGSRRGRPPTLLALDTFEIWGILFSKKPRGDKPAQHSSGQAHGPKYLHHPYNLYPATLNINNSRNPSSSSSSSLKQPVPGPIYRPPV